MVKECVLTYVILDSYILIELRYRVNSPLGRISSAASFAPVASLALPTQIDLVHHRIPLGAQGAAEMTLPLCVDLREIRTPPGSSPTVSFPGSGRDDEKAQEKHLP